MLSTLSVQQITSNFLYYVFYVLRQKFNNLSSKHFSTLFILADKYIESL